jgi:hypothetical protein
MACPYFYPVERFSESAWRKHPRLPLGDPYTGCCRADAVREWTPDQDSLREFCNMGYARSRCPRFPAGNGPDAYRFTIVTDTGDTLSVFYVAELGHSTLESGMLEYSPATGRISQGKDGETFQKQARAYVESYLRRKHEPDNEAKNPHRR